MAARVSRLEDEHVREPGWITRFQGNHTDQNLERTMGFDGQPPVGRSCRSGQDEAIRKP
jgi:hypothetical protein